MHINYSCLNIFAARVCKMASNRSGIFPRYETSFQQPGQEATVHYHFGNSTHYWNVFNNPGRYNVQFTMDTNIAQNQERGAMSPADHRYVARFYQTIPSQYNAMVGIMWFNNN